MKSGMARAARMPIIATTISRCKLVVMPGIVKIEMEGTPLILKLRKIPDRLALTRGSGMPKRATAVTANVVMEAIAVSANRGLISAMINPSMK